MVFEDVGLRLHDELGQVFLGEWEKLRILVVLILQVLQQHLLLILIQLSQFQTLLPLAILLLVNLHLLTLLLALTLRVFIYVLLHDEFLQLAHLLRVQIQTHLLSSGYQIWVDRLCSLVLRLLLLSIVLLLFVVVDLLAVRVVLLSRVHSLIIIN